MLDEIHLGIRLMLVMMELLLLVMGFLILLLLMMGFLMDGWQAEGRVGVVG